MSKFTKAPWKVYNGHFETRWILSGADRVAVVPMAEINPEHDDADEDGFYEAEVKAASDSKLIAAAPGLYDFIHRLSKMDGNQNYDDISLIIKNANEIIKSLDLE